MSDSTPEHHQDSEPEPPSPSSTDLASVSPPVESGDESVPPASEDHVDASPELADSSTQGPDESPEISEDDESSDEAELLADRRPDLPTTNFDTIIVGTGILPGLVAASRTRVLHHRAEEAKESAGEGDPEDPAPGILVLDPAEFYGGDHATFHMGHLPELKRRRQSPLVVAEEEEEGGEMVEEVSDVDATKIARALLCRAPLEFLESIGDDKELVRVGRRLSFDRLTKFLFAAGETTQVLVKSSIASYMEFRAMSRILVWYEGKWVIVPASRGAVFESDLLELREKRFLMKFFKTVMLMGKEEVDREDVLFLDFCEKSRLSEKLIRFLFGAILLSGNRAAMSRKEGIERVRMFMGSLGRYAVNSAMLYPTYGISELAQSFARAAAVYGATYVLGRNIVEVDIEEEGEENRVTGCVCTNGQHLTCDNLVLSECEYRRLFPEVAPSAKPSSFIYRAVCFGPSGFVVASDYVDGGYRFGLFLATVPPNSPELGNESVLYCTQFDQSSKMCSKDVIGVSFQMVGKCREDEDSSSCVQVLHRCVEKLLLAPPAHVIMYRIPRFDKVESHLDNVFIMPEADEHPFLQSLDPVRKITDSEDIVPPRSDAVVAMMSSREDHTARLLGIDQAAIRKAVRDGSAAVQAEAAPESGVDEAEAAAPDSGVDEGAADQKDDEAPEDGGPESQEDGS